MSLVDELSTALRRGEICAYYQPQIDVLSGRFVAVEALARWRHPQHGLLSPDIFIPAAREHHLLDEIGLYMVDEAWRQARMWRDDGLPVQVSVNVSAVQFGTDALVERLLALAARSGLPPWAVTVEITESEEFIDPERAADGLRRVREAGIGVSIDDYGVGHSTRERLDSLPVSELKIDISMVQDETDEGYASLLDVAEYARERDIRVVAEGVETEAQRRRVELLRCERAQGFLWAQPMAAEAISALLTEQSRR